MESMEFDIMDMVAQLKNRIEDYWQDLNTKGPFNRAIREGEVTPEWVLVFLVNLHYLVQLTPKHMKMGMAQAERIGDQKLKAFFAQKYREEQGHEKWAEDDINNIRGRLKKDSYCPDIDPLMIRLVKHIESLIEQDPYLYLSYTYLAEYLCVLAGPTMTRDLEVQCGFPPRSITVIENHAQLDKEHVDEWENVINDLVDGDVYAEIFMKTMEQNIAFHKAFFWTCGRKAGVQNAAA